MKRRPIPDEWPQIVLATANAGPADLGKFADGMFPNLAPWPDLVFCQEFGDRGDLRHVFGQHGYSEVPNQGKAGQKSTPTFYRRSTMTLRRPWYVSLLGPVFAGKGAGPSRLKPKWLDGATLIHDASGRRVQGASYHAPASQQFARRRRLALTAIRKITPAFGRALLRAIGMDSNDHSGQIDRELNAHGWTSSDDEGRPLKTHGNNIYDRIFWMKHRLVRFVEHHTVRIGSDHLGKVCTLAIKPRRKARK